MKRLHFIWVVFASLIVFSGCKKMDSTYQQYIVPGGIQYPGKAKSARVLSGNKRAEVVWLRGSDPKVVKAKIFWNNFADSVEVAVSANQDTIRYTFSNLEENFYTFTIRTYDAGGHVSVPVEVSGNVYGEKYQSRILERPVKAAVLNNSNILKIEWTAADTLTGAFATDVEYTSSNGALKTVRSKAKELNLTIPDYKPGTTFRYRTLYLPDSLAIDTFYSGYLTNDRYKLDKKEWSVKAYDNQHSAGENAVINIIDGDPGTRWHGQVGGSGYPHFVTIDMGLSRTVTQLSLWRMTDDERAPDVIQVLTSNDNITFVDQGTFAFNRFINDEQIFTLLNPAAGRYFKLAGLSGPEQYLVLGEVDVTVK